MRAVVAFPDVVESPEPKSAFTRPSRSRLASAKRANLPALLTVDEVADVLRTTRKGIYSQVERAQLPGVVRLGRRLLVREDALLDWLGQKSLPSPER